MSATPSAPAATPIPAPPIPAPHAAPAPSIAQQRLAAERTILDRLRAQFGAAVQGERTFAAQLWIDIAPEAIHNVLRFLRDDPQLEFKMLTDITCADYLKMPEYARDRFGLTYLLFSMKLDVRVRLKVWLNEGALSVQSACDLFGAANWAERELFDLYGIDFRGHPSLKRILLPEGYEGHPLRKDYPLKGRGERDSFPVLTRLES